MLNHSVGNSTCSRCRLHFKRPDLLHRHMLRHQQKDQDAGGPGLGVVESRKKMWLAPDGKIVPQRPVVPTASDAVAATGAGAKARLTPLGPKSGGRIEHDGVAPSQPPMLSVESFEHFSMLHPDLSCASLSAGSPHQVDILNFLANSSAASRSSVVGGTGLTPNLEAICSNAGSPFELPITSLNLHSTLFNLGWEQKIPYFGPEELHGSTAPHNSGWPNSYPAGSLEQRRDDSSHNLLSSSHSDIESRSWETSSTATSLDHGGNGSWALHSTQLQDPTTDVGIEIPYAFTTSKSPFQSGHGSPFPPMARSQSRSSVRLSRPTIDPASRERILKVLIDAQPKFPDGTKFTVDHPLLSLSRMQTYLDLFFSYFNIAYPLLHQPTFDPAQSEALLLLSIILLGATYSDESAHALAVSFLHEMFDLAG
jgi:hypothetical protein